MCPLASANPTRLAPGLLPVRHCRIPVALRPALRSAMLLFRCVPFPPFANGAEFPFPARRFACASSTSASWLVLLLRGIQNPADRCLSSLSHYASTSLSFSFVLTHISAPRLDRPASPAGRARSTPAASRRAVARSLLRRSAGPRPARRTTYLSRSALTPRQEAVRLPRPQAPAAFLVSARAAVRRSVRRRALSGFRSPASAGPLHKRSVHTIRCTPAAGPALRTNLK